MPSWPAVVLAAISYIPLLLTAPGYVGDDNKLYLYLDPGTLLSRAPYLWDKHTGMGGVTHQNIGYLFPQGPWYWIFQQLMVPDWVTQRLWTGTVLFAAGAGVLALMRTFGWKNRPAFLAAASYMLSPYVLEYVARTSVILLPWAGMPWMVALVIRGLRAQAEWANRTTDGSAGPLRRWRTGLTRWRYPALFALVLASISGTNASSVIFAALAPTIWVIYAVVRREVSLRGATAFSARSLLLSAGVCLWWAGGLTDQAGYGLNILKYTETIQTVSSTSTPTEVLRSLGLWFFYGSDAVSSWIHPSGEYMHALWLIAVSFALPVLALAAAACTRWAHRGYFVVLIVVGTALGVGVYPYDHPSPFGQLFKDFANGSTSGLALRSSPRAVPLLALGFAVLLTAGVEALFRLPARRRDNPPRVVRARLRRWAPRGAFVAVLVLIALDMTPLWTGQFVDPNLRRPEALPSYVTQAAQHLQAAQPLAGAQTRVLEEPGADFSYYRWGDTLEPPLPGLMNRPYVSRAAVPEGEPASAALIRALDEPIQEGVADPTALAPLARLMGVGDVVLRSDLQYERFLTPQPIATWAQFTQPLPTGLGVPKTFGPPVAETPSIPFENEITLGDAPTDAKPPAMADFPVTDPVPIVRAEHAGAPLLVAGDSSGLVDASGAGLLGSTGVVRFAAKAGGTVASAPVAPDADLLLTDTNQKRAESWNTLDDNFGYVETATGQPLVADPRDARLPVFPDQTTADQTIAVLSGVKDVEASGYGDPVSYAPSQQPFNAIDGDPTTAWTVGAFSDPRGERLQVVLLHPETAPSVTLVQQHNSTSTRTITQARLTFSGGPHGSVSELVRLNGSSLTDAGQRVAVPASARGYRTVDFTIVQTSNGSLKTYAAQSGVGLSELSIPGVRASEVLRLPTDLFNAAGTNGAQQALTIMLDRDRVNPQTPYKTDPELSMAREFTLPTARTFGVGGTARISARALDSVLDALVGRTGVTATASSALPGSLDARASSALDGDPDTAWTNAFGGNVGSWIQVHSPTAATLSSLNLQVIADGLHSVPTSLKLIVDGKQVRDITLPPSTDQKAKDATVTLPVRFAPVTGHTFRFVITGERAETTTDYFQHTPQILPVAIAELGAPGLVVGAPAATVQGGCRSDLLTVDNKPVPVKITGSTTAAIARDGLSVSLCGAPLALSAGTHILRTARGVDTGVDLDQLLLSSQPGGGAANPAAPFPGQVRTAAAPHVLVTKQGPVSYDLAVTGATPGRPFWLVLGQSLSPGWQATIDGHTQGQAQLVDGYANGWLVTPTSSTFTVALRWTAQTKVWIGVAISAITLLICVMLVLRPRRVTLGRPSVPATPGDESLPYLVSPWSRDGGRHSRSRTVAAILIAAGIAAFLITPLVGLIVLAVTLLAVLVPRGRTLLRAGSVAALALSAVYVLEVQARFHLLASSGWPQRFHKVDTLSWVAVALLVADVLVGWARRDAPGEPTSEIVSSAEVDGPLT
jgi:hypothetical protein